MAEGLGQPVRPRRLLPALLGMLAACGRGDDAEPGPPTTDAMVESVPGCARQIETRGAQLAVQAELRDVEGCEDGTLVVTVRWADGRTQALTLEGMGFPSDLQVIDLHEDGSEDLLIGHQDLSGEPPRVRAFESVSGGQLRDFELEPPIDIDLPGYAGGGHFHTRGGRLFFSHPAPSGERTIAYNERLRVWEEIDLSRFETDRPR